MWKKLPLNWTSWILTNWLFNFCKESFSNICPHVLACHVITSYILLYVFSGWWFLHIQSLEMSLLLPLPLCSLLSPLSGTCIRHLGFKHHTVLNTSHHTFITSWLSAGSSLVSSYSLKITLDDMKRWKLNCFAFSMFHVKVSIQAWTRSLVNYFKVDIWGFEWQVFTASGQAHNGEQVPVRLNWNEVFWPCFRFKNLTKCKTKDIQLSLC